MNLPRHRDPATLMVLVVVHLLLLPYGKSSAANLLDIDSNRGTRVAYQRWKSWFLDQTAAKMKVPPVPATVGGSCSINSTVSVQFTPINILYVSEGHQSVQLSAKLDLLWVDEAFRLNDSLVQSFTDGQDSLMPAFITVPAESLWFPPIIVAEGIDELTILSDARFVNVDQNGSVVVGLGIVRALSCRFQMDAYPFDQHDCSVTFIDTSDTVNLVSTGARWDQKFAESTQVDGEWKLTQCTSRPFRLPGTDAWYVQFLYRIERKTTFYIVSIIVPMVLTSYVNTLVFLVPPDMGDKTSYLVTIMISLSVFISFFMTLLPRGIESSLPRVLQLVTFLGVEGCVCLVMTLVVLRKYKTEQDQQQGMETDDTSGEWCERKNQVSPAPDSGHSVIRKASTGKLSAKRLDNAFFVIAITSNTVGLATIFFAEL